MEKFKSSMKINWDNFQNDAKAFKHLKKMLHLVSKYEGITIAKMVSMFKKDELTRDQMQLSAMNVFIAVYAAKAESLHTRTYGIRKSKYAENFVMFRERSEERVTDSLAREKAEKAIKKFRLKEAKAHELFLVYHNVMWRVNKVLDSIDSANRSLMAEDRRTK